MKRNAILTFLFSLIPGAGHMYYGLYRQGLQLMGLFLFIFGIAEFLNMDILLLVLPLIWFFSFFHINNLSKLSQEEFARIKDHWFLPKSLELETKPLYKELSQYTPSIATVLIFIGVFLLGRNIVEMLEWMLPTPLRDFMNALTWRLPQLFVSVIIIYIGIHMIQTKKKELDKEESTNGEETK